MDVASETSGPLIAGSALAGKGREARIISIILGASFSAGGSWVTVGGFVALGAIPWFAFFSFSVPSGYLTTLEGVSEEVGTLAVPSLPASATLEAVSVLELGGTDSRMAEG